MRLHLLSVAVLTALLLVCTATQATAYQLPLDYPASDSPSASAEHEAPLPDSHPVCPGIDSGSDSPAARTRRVAVIGAGPSGSSAAYFLKTAQDHLNSRSANASGSSSKPADTIKVTIFEREERVGGRTAVAYPYDDEGYEPVELGASLYADVNYNMRRAVKQFGLATGAQNGVGGETGVWDGQQFLVRGDASSWWTSARFFLRYGTSPLTAQKLLKKKVSSFLRLYSASFLHRPSRNGSGADHGANRTASGFPWSTISGLAEAVDVASEAGRSALDYYTSNGVSTLFVEEIIEGLTRANYAQDTPAIHGFGGLISLALSGATGLKDGNFRVFEEFVKRSGATLRTGEAGRVTGLVKFDSLRDAIQGGKLTCKEAASWGWTGREVDEPRWWVGTRDGEGELFDAVVVGAPWHDAEITLVNTDRRIARPPYVHLYVTLLATTARSADPEYFGLGKGDDVPRTILTSDESVRRARTEAALASASASAGPGTDKDKTPNVEFISLNYLRPLRFRNGTLWPTTADGSRSHVVKIFSLSPFSDAQLHRLFPASSIGWVHRKEWYSYPLLTPRTTFPRIEVDENLVFPNAFESLASTMETSIVASRNAVGLLLRKWYGEEFVNGGEGCPWMSDGEEEEQEGEEGEEEGGEGWEQKVLENEEWAGWGCRSG